MKILYLSAIDSNKDWGAEGFLNQAFNQLGHETICLDYRTNRDRLYDKITAVPDFDVFLLQRGEGVPVELIELIDRPRFFYDSELPYRLPDHADLVRSGVFDHYFFWTRGIIDDLTAWGWVDPAKCSVMNGAFYPPLHRPMPELERDIDILFMASLTPRRQQFLQSLAGRLKLTGLNAFGQDMVTALNRAKIVLNIHATDYVITETRVYEVLGCQAFLLTERLPPGHPFAAGKDLVEFGGPDDLLEKCRYYLEHPAEREAIAAQGRASALAGYTTTHLAQLFIDRFQTLLGSRGPTAA